MRSTKFLAVALVASWACGAAADEPFVRTDTVDVKALLAAPPADDSDQTKQEIQHILDLQQKRTPDEIKRAQSEAKLSVFAFSDVLGSWFNPDDLPETATLMKEVGKETDAVARVIKDAYARRRPFLQDSDIHPCVDLEKTGSYPSGHSSRGTAWAIILAEMFPDQKDALLARGRQIGDDRVLAGVHFPSDVEAGRVLGAIVAREMLADLDFQAQLAKVKAECAAKRK